MCSTVLAVQVALRSRTAAERQAVEHPTEEQRQAFRAAERLAREFVRCLNEIFVSADHGLRRTIFVLAHGPTRAQVATYVELAGELGAKLIEQGFEAALKDAHWQQTDEHGRVCGERFELTIIVSW